MKKLIISILAILIIGGTAFVWNGSVAPEVVRAATIFDSHLEGNGTSNNPFILRNPYDLIRMEHYSQTSGFQGLHFRLANSIDMSHHGFNSQSSVVPGEYPGFRGIGGSSDAADSTAINPRRFRGIFDGAGHTININLRYGAGMGATARGGLFNYIHGATIKNLTMTGFIRLDADTSVTTVGGLFGTAIRSNIQNVIINIEVHDTATTAGDAFVGGLGGRIINANDNLLGRTGIYTDIQDVSMRGSVASGRVQARVGGLVGQIERDGSPIEADRLPVRFHNITVVGDASIEASSTGQTGHSYIPTRNPNVGAIVGRVGNGTNLALSDIRIGSPRLVSPSQRTGSLAGHLSQNTRMTGVNLNIDSTFEFPLTHEHEANWTRERVFTFRFNSISNIRVRNVREGDRVDVRPNINQAIVVNQAETTITLNTVVREARDQSLKLDHNTKLVVQSGGVSVIEANLMFDGVVLYTRVFNVNVSMAWPTWLNLLILGIIIALLVALWQIVLLKKHRNIRAWFRNRKDGRAQKKVRAVK